MRRFRCLSVFAAVLIALPLTSCSEQTPLEPAPPAALSADDSATLLLGGLTEGLLGTVDGTLDLTGSLISGVLACPSSQTYTATKTIGIWGGAIDVGPHRLVIPPYALRQNVTITATAPAGSVTTLYFEPHGLTFERPTALTMSYAHCGLLSGLTKRLVYVDVDQDLKILEILPSLNNFWLRKVTGKLDHFSAYAVAE